MANVRYLVDDVDAALGFYVGALGFALVERWGPPFAMVRRDDLTLWLSGPGTSRRGPCRMARNPSPADGTGWFSRWTISTRRFMRCAPRARVSATMS
jgi:catechol 2,3-dioxygenase-like lactoylglutathione lyase family enzyme